MELKLTRAELEVLLQTRHPTDEEMSLINQFKPYGLDPWESSELMRFALIASNNLIHSSGQVWDENVLETMVASYPGCALMIDHEWEDQSKTFGMIYDSFIYSLPRVSKEGIARILEKSPNPNEDYRIIQKDGYHQVLVFGFVEATHPIISEISYGRKADVSMGGIFYGESICPICDIPYSDPKCPHYPPYMAGLVDEEILTPYYRRSGKMDSIECSFVASGNCRQARLIDSRLNTFVFT